MSKTVLLFTDSHSLCGVGQFNATLLEALVDTGYKTVCAQRYEDTPLQAKLKKLGVTYHWFDSNPDKLLNEFANDRLAPASIFDTYKPDAIVFSNGHLQLSFAAIDVAAQLRIPYLIREGLVAEALLPPGDAQIAAFRRHYLAASRVICMGSENRALLTTHFGLPDNFGQIISPGASEMFFEPVDRNRRRRLREEWGVPQDAVLAITTAKLEPVKGHAIQLSALNRLRQRNEAPDLHFAWAGTGSLEQDISDALQRLDLADRVHLIGHVWNVAEILDAADLFVLTSHAEGLPGSVVEAMAKGLPVIATDVGGTREAVSGAGHLLADPSDDETTMNELIEVLNEWHDSPALRRGAGIRGRERAKAHYRERDAIRRYLAAIEEATRPGGR